MTVDEIGGNQVSLRFFGNFRKEAFVGGDCWARYLSIHVDYGIWILPC